MSNENKGLIAGIEAKLDEIGEKLKKVEMNIPTDLVGGLLFLIFGIVMLLVIPGQVEIKKKELVNGRAFPNLLMYVTIACSLVLIAGQVIKMVKKEPVRQTKINLLVEVKAVIMFLMMLVFFFVAQWADNFAVGACVYGFLMLLYFRCKKPLYYVIVMAAGIGIWAAFRFGLGVMF